MRSSGGRPDFWQVNDGLKSKSEPRCVLLASCGCFTEDKREKRMLKAQIPKIFQRRKEQGTYQTLTYFPLLQHQHQTCHQYFFLTV